jgi:tetratricopeptide (TPR) repeat protein
MKKKGNKPEKEIISIETEDLAFKEYLFNEYAKPFLKPSKMKSLEACTTEAKQQIDEHVNMLKKDLQKGVELFLAKVTPKDADALNKILKKTTPITASEHTKKEIEAHLITPEDVLLLEKIASEVLAHGNPQDAGCMFRTIIACVPFYSPAWVGSALSELRDKNKENAEMILRVAMELFPEDAYIQLYAGRVYLADNRKKEAREVLKKASENLVNQHQEASEDYKEVKKLLSVV